MDTELQKKVIAFALKVALSEAEKRSGIAHDIPFPDLSSLTTDDLVRLLDFIQLVLRNPTSK